ncbi:MAG TPA: HAMP domain-containing protein, partial [Ktedonobacteraceae bacterium]|nr:HAMP domain-containing protein [Ktedonobacteraceae bacterium]
MGKPSCSLAVAWRRVQLSLFEKVILANSIMLIGEALAGLWITSHNIEAHHYLIDTSFIVLAALLGLFVNILILRASFRPLFLLLATIREISAGKTHERATIMPSDSEISELAQSFNSMLDRLAVAKREQTTLILQAQEEERRRLALELHDESSQNLTALLVYIEVMGQQLTALPNTSISQEARTQLEGGLTGLTGIAQHTLDNIRTLAQQLRPSVLDDLGLHAALRWLAEDARQRLRLSVELSLEEVEHTLHNQQGIDTTLYGTIIFRIAQESLTNIARHAHAQHAWLSLKQEHDSICLTVRDDGSGFDTTKRPPGLGIFGMNERATQVGGSVHIQA